MIRELEACGILCETVAGTNVIGRLGKDVSGRRIALRADMPAFIILPGTCQKYGKRCGMGTGVWL